MPSLPFWGERGKKCIGSGSRVHGIAEIGFAYRDGTTRLAHLYQRDPLRVLFPEPAEGDSTLAVLVTTSGGLVAGDRLDIAVSVGAGAAAHVTASAAEKIYRSLGETATIEQRLAVGEGGWLEFLLPETILFEDARLCRKTVVDLVSGAGLLAGDITVFGRHARGERFSRGLFRDVWQIHRDGDLVWGDALHLDGDIAATIDHPACFDGAAAFATMILAPRNGEAGPFLDAARAVQATVPGLRAGATVVGGLLLARWLAADPALLRRAYADLACHLREAAMGLPAQLPRLWHV
jgi:urease accessory protein